MKCREFFNNLKQTFSIDQLKKEFKLKSVVLIGLGFLINTACWAITSLLHWSIWLDTLGTVINSLLVGPLVGMTTGIITSVLWFFIEPSSILFTLVHAIIGFIPGYAITWNWLRDKPKLEYLGLPLLISFITVFVSTIIRVLFCIELTVCYTLAEGVANYFINFFYELARVFFTDRFAREVIDKTLVVIMAWLFIRAPKFFKQKRWWKSKKTK